MEVRVYYYCYYYYHHHHMAVEAVDDQK